MKFFTFCVDIGRHSRHDMVFSLINQIKSIHKFVKKYHLICYTNFDINKDQFQEYKIEFRSYYDKSDVKMYNDKWLNLSFNKINIFKDLYDEFNESYIWIDLDTYIVHNIDYINDLSHAFTIIGGNGTNSCKLFTNADICVVRQDYIQGDFWKLSIELYNDLMITLESVKEQKLQLEYDLQSLYNYHIYIKNNYQNFNILGKNMYSDYLYGLSVWNEKSNAHPSIEGLKKLWYEDGNLKSGFNNKEIHILSFTFFTLKKLKDTLYFKKLFEDMFNL